MEKLKRAWSVYSDIITFEWLAARWPQDAGERFSTFLKKHRLGRLLDRLPCVGISLVMLLLLWWYWACFDFQHHYFIEPGGGLSPEAGVFFIGILAAPIEIVGSILYDKFSARRTDRPSHRSSVAPKGDGEA